MANNSPLPFTKYGDKGCTMLADCTKDKKTSIRVQAIGDIDELNSSIGIASKNIKVTCSIKRNECIRVLTWLQHMLFVAGTDCATPMDSETNFRINETHIEHIENCIERIHNKLDALGNFIIPNHELHLCRSIARRAERSCWITYSECGEFNENCLIFLNRCSDLLFTLARYVTHDEIWDQTVL
jgi:cob(I)alamin adenosyltransferase